MSISQNKPQKAKKNCRWVWDVLATAPNSPRGNDFQHNLLKDMFYRILHRQPTYFQWYDVLASGWRVGQLTSAQIKECWIWLQCECFDKRTVRTTTSFFLRSGRRGGLSVLPLRLPWLKLPPSNAYDVLGFAIKKYYLTFVRSAPLCVISSLVQSMKKSTSWKRSGEHAVLWEATQRLQQPQTIVHLAQIRVVTKNIYSSKNSITWLLPTR